MIIKKYINFFLFLSFFKIIQPHGFGGHTVIQESSGNYWRIDYLVDYIADGQHLDVVSYDEFTGNFFFKKIKAAGFCESEYHSRLFFDQDINALECTPLQLFYRVKDHAWVAAFKLKAGDKLLCADNKTVEVTNVDLVHEKIKVYTLEIKDTHTFLVTRHRIVAHNMLIPAAAVAGLTIPFDIGCGASVGSVFGPVGICAGVVVGGAVGCIVNACIKDRVAEYKISFKRQDVASFTQNNKKEVQDNNHGAQAPGKPTGNDGFIPKNNWNGEKVKHRRGFGWPDKKGSIWIPSGPNGHGSPHWDVQHPDGSYDNILPGGKIRGQK